MPNGTAQEPPQPPPQPVTFEVSVPAELVGGVYSNVVNVWHTAYEFTLDFGVMEPPRQDEVGIPVVPCPVVSRVRMPVTVLFDLLRALNANMTQYENTFGEIKAPQVIQGGEHAGGNNVGDDA